MKGKLHIAFVTILLLAGNLVYGQDPQFSLFSQNPILTNPAHTGVFDGNIRIKAAYRDQWSSLIDDLAFKTYHVSYDQRINLFGSKLGLGGHIIRDQVGKGRYGFTMAQANVSYILKLGASSPRGKQSYLSSALYVGAGQNSVDWNRLSYERQFNTSTGFLDSTFDTGEGAMEDVLSTSFYPDFGFGFLYYQVDKDGLSYQAGLAVHHIAEPSIGLREANNATLYRKISIHGQASIRLSKSDLILYPSTLFIKQGPAMMWMLGSQIGIKQSQYESFSIRGGAHLRIVRSLDGLGVSDFILSGLFELEKIKIGLSYDITLSDLNIASRRRGALELNLVYILPRNTRRVKDFYPSY